MDRARNMNGITHSFVLRTKQPGKKNHNGSHCSLFLNKSLRWESFFFIVYNNKVRRKEVFQLTAVSAAENVGRPSTNCTVGCHKLLSRKVINFYCY